VDSPCSFFDASPNVLSPASTSQRAAPTTPFGYAAPPNPPRPPSSVPCPPPPVAYDADGCHWHHGGRLGGPYSACFLVRCSLKCRERVSLLVQHWCTPGLSSGTPRGEAPLGVRFCAPAVHHRCTWVPDSLLLVAVQGAALLFSVLMAARPAGFPDLHPSPCSPASKRVCPWDDVLCPWAPMKKRPKQPPFRPARHAARNLFGAANPGAGP